MFVVYILEKSNKLSEMSYSVINSVIFFYLICGQSEQKNLVFETIEASARALQPLLSYYALPEI